MWTNSVRRHVANLKATAGDEEAVLFLAAAEEKGDVRVALDQCAQCVMEGRQIGAGQFAAHEAAGEPVELPQQALPTIEQ